MYDVNKNSLKQILTLRYDTTLTSALPELRWEDYKRKDKSSNILSFIEESIVKSIHNDQNNLKSAAISLSSGIDSTLIATIIKKNFPDLEINSLSITFSDSFDESPFAKKIADRLDINHHVVFIDNFLEELPKAIKITQKPFWDLHWYHIAKEAKKYSKNFFSGDGGDELFGGYTFRYKKYLSLVSSRSSVKERIQAYLSCHERDWVPEQEKIFTSKLDFRWEQIFPILEKFFHNDLDLIEQVFLADYNGKLRHNMEPLYKKFHKFFDMSYLAPMLNESLIRFSTNLPHNLKYNPETNQGKIPLVELCKKYSMYDLISKEKKGFSVDTNNMWKNYGQKTCQYFLDDGRIIKDGWIKEDWIKNNISRSDLDVRYINKFLGLLAFEIWYRLFVTNEMKENEKLKF
tara:strand:- start:6 stop:1214 length:1209 start_codon:yes stop_codon:yes gene_type:complete